MKIHLALVNPEASARWGQPLFVDGSGRPVYLGRGADGTDDDGEGDGDSGATDDADDDSDGEDDGDKKDKKKPGEEADAEALRKKMKLADKRAAEAERKLRELEDKDKGELEVTQRKLAEATETNAKLLKQVRDQALENAFLSTNEITWHDPDDALTAAQRAGLLEGIQDEDGEVDKAKLKTALQKLAKAKPHYVKGTEEEAGATKGNGGPTGTSTGSGRKKGTADGPTEQQLRDRYSALRR
jgi:hypothetical protein